jgi:RNA polymerase sigma-70 factor (ECF subfamily)
LRIRISGKKADTCKDCSLDNIKDALAYRLLEGDKNAVYELVDMYYHRIYLYMRRLGHSRQTSEDLTQEIFLQAWKHIGQLRNTQALGGWIYRIAGNVSNQYWRKHKGKEQVSIDEILPPNSTDERDSSRTSEDQEQILRLHEAVERLPLKLKQAVILHYMQHLTISEAAEVMGVSEGTLKSRLNRALKILKKKVD